MKGGLDASSLQNVYLTVVEKLGILGEGKLGGVLFVVWGHGHT